MEVAAAETGADVDADRRIGRRISVGGPIGIAVRRGSRNDAAAEKSDGGAYGRIAKKPFHGCTSLPKNTLRPVAPSLEMNDL